MTTPSLRVFRWAVLAALTAGVQAAEPDDPVQAVQKAASEWIKIRSENSRLETEWRNEHSLLAATVGGLKDRAANLEEKRDNLKVRTAADRTEIEDLRAKQRSEAEELNQIDGQLKLLAEKLVKMREALPPRLSSALELPYRSLASAGTVGERMQYSLTILNRCAQFNRLVDSGEEVVPLEGAGKSMATIYWGLSHGYALDRRARKVWLGSPVAGRWQWEPLDHAADAVERLIAIHHDKADPQFVPVPARLAATSTSVR